MHKISATLLFLSLCFASSLCAVHAQSITADQDRLQRQIDELRSDVNQLRTIVGTLQKATQKRDSERKETDQEKISRPTGREIDTLTPAEQERIKAEACYAVGQFFVQIDKALQMADNSEAELLMDKAVEQLKSTIEKYGQSKKLSNIISLADDLAYDTDWAVRLRSSSSGNADFIEYLRDYKDKYQKRCGKP
ncbi:MAG: hypothetical protein V1897_13885 [Pseudomonadota bacterium]